MQDRSGFIRRVAPAVLVVTAILAASGTPAALGTTPQAGAPRVCGPNWQIVRSPNPADALSSRLFSVAALSATDAWAVGSQVSEPNNVFTVIPLVEHWDGLAWSEVATPPLPNNANLTGLYAVAPHDIWATGNNLFDITESTPLAEHWNGHSWTVVPTPDIQFANFFGVGGTSSRDIWAVGTIRGMNPSMLILHWTGRRWTMVAVPAIDSDFVALSAVSSFSETDAWAAGSFLGAGGSSKPLLMHFDGTSWTRVAITTSSTSEMSLNDVEAIGPGEAWAVGQSFDGTVNRTIAMHRVDGHADFVATPNVGTGDNFLAGLDAGPDGRLWAVGSWLGTDGNAQTLTEVMTGSDWTVVPSRNHLDTDNRLSGVAASPDGDIWAVGGWQGKRAAFTLIEHRCG
jgi:hypothetical protein